MIVSFFDPSLVLDAVRITGLVTLVVMAFGSAFPKFFEKIQGALLVALFAVNVIEGIEIFIFASIMTL